MYTEQLSEALGVMATIDPQLVDNATVSSDLVDMGVVRRLMFVLNVGATDTTVDAKLREAQDSGGTGEQDLSGKAITQLGATDDNKQVIIEVAAEELSAGFTHVSLDVTVGDGDTGAYVSAVGLGGIPRHHPASDDDLASVAEIVA
jgi:hypothetical protein